MKTFEEYIGLNEARGKGQGIFNMDITHKLEKMELEAGKKLLQAIVNKDTTAKPENIDKATAMIKSAASVKALIIAVDNFIMKYQELGVIK